MFALLIANKYAAGALALLALLAALWGYGRYEHSRGWNERDTKAKLDLAARQTALYNEQTRLENERDAADQKYQQLKTDTASRAADLDAIVKQLRGQLSTAGNQHKGANTAGGTNDSNPDWVGIVGTCWGDYAELGKEAATYADRVNGLQGYVRAMTAPQ